MAIPVLLLGWFICSSVMVFEHVELAEDGTPDAASELWTKSAVISQGIVGYGSATLAGAGLVFAILEGNRDGSHVGWAFAVFLVFGCIGAFSIYAAHTPHDLAFVKVASMLSIVFGCSIIGGIGYLFYFDTRSASAGARTLDLIKNKGYSEEKIRKICKTILEDSGNYYFSYSGNTETWDPKKDHREDLQTTWHTKLFAGLEIGLGKIPLILDELNKEKDLETTTANNIRRRLKTPFEVVCAELE